MKRLLTLLLTAVVSLSVAAQSADQLYEEGKKLYVHHMQDVETGATVEIEKVLLADNDGVVTVGTPTVEGAKVVLEVLVPLIKGDKVLVFHKRRRKGYRKLRGYRDQFTQVLVKSVVA